MINPLLRIDLGGGGGGAGGGVLADQSVIPGVAVTPGWQVVSAFQFVSSVPQVALQAILLVSTALLTGRVRIFDTVTSLAVAGSTLTFAGNTVDDEQVTADLSAVLVAGRIYQIQVECTGGATQGDFATLRSASFVKP